MKKNILLLLLLLSFFLPHKTEANPIVISIVKKTLPIMKQILINLIKNKEILSKIDYLNQNEQKDILNAKDLYPVIFDMLLKIASSDKDINQATSIINYLEQIPISEKIFLSGNILLSILNISIDAYIIHDFTNQILEKIEQSDKLMKLYFDQMYMKNQISFDHIEKKIERMEKNLKLDKIRNIQSKFRCFRDTYLIKNKDIQKSMLLACLHDITIVIDFLDDMNIQNTMIYAYFQMYYSYRLLGENILKEEYFNNFMTTSSLEEMVQQIDSKLCKKYDCNHPTSELKFLKNKLNIYHQENMEMDISIDTINSIKRQIYLMFEQDYLNHLMSISKQDDSNYKITTSYQNQMINDQKYIRLQEKKLEKLNIESEDWIKDKLKKLKYYLEMEVILKKYQGYANEYKFICEDDLGILSHPKSSLKDIALEEIDGPIIVKNLNHVKIKFDLLDLNKHSNLKPRCTFEFISAHNDENQTIRFDFNIANLRNPSNIPYSKSTNHIDLSISVKIDETFTD